MAMPKLSTEQSIFAKGMKAGMEGTSQAEPMKRPEPPKEVTVRQADNGGYIVSTYDENYSRKESVYEDIEGVVECIQSKLGKGKKKG